MADTNDLLRAHQQMQSLIASTSQNAMSGKPIFGIFSDRNGLFGKGQGFFDKPILQAGRGKKPGLFKDIFGEGVIEGFKKCAEAGAVRECNPAEVYGNAQHGLDSGIQGAQLEKPQIGPDIQTMGGSVYGRG